MKFYNPECGMYMEVATGGQWATREDAEQAAKDAVRVGRVLLKILPLITNSQHWEEEVMTIIDRYEGGKG